MLSKFLTLRATKFLVPKVSVQYQMKRMNPCSMLPANQYDVRVPRKLHLTYALQRYWEIIPLFLATCTSLTFMVLSIAWALFNKVDVVYSTHNRETISRTMDLRWPSVHKVVTINQRYEPWPELQDVLDKMAAAERHAVARMQACAHA